MRGVGRGFYELADYFEGIDEGGGVVRVGEVVCLDEGWVEWGGGAEGDVSSGHGAEEDGAKTGCALSGADTLV